MAQWKRTLGLFQSSELLVVLEWASKFKMLSSYVRKPCNVASILPFRHLKEKKTDIKNIDDIITLELGLHTL